MKIQNALSKFAALLVAGSLSFGAFAAEDAHGVKRATEEALKASQDALEQAKAGQTDAAIASSKLYRQKAKEITGAAAGISLQKAMGSAKGAATDLEAGNNAAAIEKLTDVVTRMTDINANTK
ncbi:hypothetical protein [Methylococcus mesophilus]|uniref:hypothetical protein n=1 Tax=Methylococcus mesophilus TaxID=2993564 RepID=UPI00224B9190|nr:hypothetical protein [Methylococcus mesophilus]UZR27743.1 hypothetical protein OOT43_13535 [Methylococcus mesophilus]